MSDTSRPERVFRFLGQFQQFMFSERGRLPSKTLARRMLRPEDGRSSAGDAFGCAAAAWTWSHGALVQKHCENKQASFLTSVRAHLSWTPGQRTGLSLGGTQRTKRTGEGESERERDQRHNSSSAKNSTSEEDEEEEGDTGKRETSVWVYSVSSRDFSVSSFGEEI